MVKSPPGLENADGSKEWAYQGGSLRILVSPLYQTTLAQDDTHKDIKRTVELTQVPWIGEWWRPVDVVTHPLFSRPQSTSTRGDSTTLVVSPRGHLVSVPRY